MRDGDERARELLGEAEQVLRSITNLADAIGILAEDLCPEEQAISYAHAVAAHEMTARSEVSFMRDIANELLEHGWGC